MTQYDVKWKSKNDVLVVNDESNMITCHGDNLKHFDFPIADFVAISTKGKGMVLNWLELEDEDDPESEKILYEAGQHEKMTSNYVAQIKQEIIRMIVRHGERRHK